MNEAVLFKLLDVALTAAAVGLEREAILGKVSELQAKGATPEQITAALVTMRDTATAEAQAKVNAAH